MKKKLYITASVVVSVLLVCLIGIFINKQMYIKKLSVYAVYMESVSTEVCTKGRVAGQLWENKNNFTYDDPSEAVADFLGAVDYSSELEMLKVLHSGIENYPIGCKDEFNKTEYVYTHLVELLEIMESSTYDYEFSKKSRVLSLSVSGGLDYLREKHPNVLK